MTKSELIIEMAARTGESKSTCERVLKAFEAAVQQKLTTGGEVQLVGFGTFAVVHKAERVGRNPKTGEPLTIAASNAVKFKPGKALKDAVQ